MFSDTDMQSIINLVIKAILGKSIQHCLVEKDILVGRTPNDFDINIIVTGIRGRPRSCCNVLVEHKVCVEVNWRKALVVWRSKYWGNRIHHMYNLGVRFKVTTRVVCRPHASEIVLVLANQDCSPPFSV